ncbi:MAG TPA: Flp family type IVb pilin [Clostridiaceae bacterium]|nr:Flp family type IVb pilin [Clostridiaceae bacterium]
MFILSEIFKLMKNRKGQGMVEYGLIIGLVALVVIGALVLLGNNLTDIFGNIAGRLGSAPVGE